jgi:predicted NBD/HSP70 family sugar kinase
MNKLANNKERMKAENRRLVLRLLHAASLSRAELSKNTHLTQAAISVIVEELMAEGIVFECGKAEQAQLGRKPVKLEINPRWGYMLGISIDHDGFELGIMDINGNIIGQAVSLPYISSPQEALDTICSHAMNLISVTPIDEKRIIGLGAIAPGPVDTKNGIILNAPGFDSWHYLNLRQELARRLPYRVFIQHNANALARAEYSFGIGKHYKSFALLAINAGIGLGMMLNERIYTGLNGMGCEIGHTSVDINGRLCTCGSRGCLEAYASTAAVLYDVNRYRKDIHTWKDFMDCVAAGDPLCRRMLDMQAGYLAHAIINLNNLLELETVIITGLALYRGELLVDLIQNRVSGSLLSNQANPLLIQLSPLKENSTVIAAGAVVTDRLYKHDLYNICANEH